jgi:protein involved in polysaccharide export with SLBB domain
MEVFRNGMADPELLPMDLPVSPDYVVGPGDGLAIDIWGGIAQRFVRTVDSEGRLALPEVGPLLVSGRTLGDVQESVQKILRTQFRDVSADVSLSRLRTIRVYVVGDVAYPGAYEISSLSTPLNAMFVASGPTDNGSVRLARHYRGKDLVQEVDVYDLLLRGVRSDVKQLQNGDTVLVPPIGPQVKVEGMVRRPAIYELHREEALAEVLELAGGILPAATLRSIQVQRLEAHEKRTMLSLDISESNPDEARTALESFLVQDGDEIRIFPIAPYNQSAVYLQGHALRPGRYSFKEGMKVTDLISSYKELLPEPAPKYAEIIRLNPPDFRPSVESFDLGAAMANPDAAPALQPMDTLRVFSRYDFEEPPRVWVGGEVFNPGTYRTSGQVHLRDAIHLAGGITPDAMISNAQLFRHLPDSKLKIFSVNLGNALTGDTIDNILLQPRDRVVIHRNLAKVDPPSVYVKGEISKPGRYPLTTNMRVSDLLRLAGGLKRSAHSQSAALTRYLVENGQNTIGEHQEIDIGAALARDPSSDVPLRDGDTLAIRQVPGWKDIGASITVAGESLNGLADSCQQPTLRARCSSVSRCKIFKRKAGRS